MKKSITLVAWSLLLSILFISIFYMITSGVSGYFLFSEDGSIFRETELCKPVWVTAGLFSVDYVCLDICQKKYSVENHKIEDLKCFCDINNCKV